MLSQELCYRSRTVLHVAKCDMRHELSRSHERRGSILVEPPRYRRCILLSHELCDASWTVDASRTVRCVTSTSHKGRDGSILLIANCAMCHELCDVSRTMSRVTSRSHKGCDSTLRERPRYRKSKLLSHELCDASRTVRCVTSR